MASLNVHQSHARDHDRLGFHPSCPICRQDRAFGVLPPDPVRALRLRALLATGLLALGGGVTATSVANEPDHQQEGVVVPEQEAPVAPGAPGDQRGPSFDPGGETALPYDGGPAPEEMDGSAGEEGWVPLEDEAVADPDPGLLLTDPETPVSPGPEAVPVPPVEAAPAPPPPSDLQSPPPVENAPPISTWQPQPNADSKPAVEERHQGKAQVAPANDPPAPTAALPQAPPPMAIPAEAPAGAPRVHVVRRGESLWSIAAALLEPRASAATIAGEVDRLWQLNAERIGTGDPDLVMVGVRLRLR
ncbi:MAG: hypothetical protein QOH58_3582 [Thermoleophilaceae bacterium]|nr:hypothetical protein [Thermoleophilaceae bacterium]